MQLSVLEIHQNKNEENETLDEKNSNSQIINDRSACKTWLNFLIVHFE